MAPTPDEALAMMAAMAECFRRWEPRATARKYVRALMSDLPRKNCWTIAEHAGDSSPGKMQHLLERAKQLRSERQRSAGAGGDSEKFTTVDHAIFLVEVEWGAEQLRSERQVPRDRSEVYARVMAISTCAGPNGESMVSTPQDHHVNLIAPWPDPWHE